ncbi:kelch repeat protein [Volvox carteri f. nagariensis]|uniref:Kelch repeat protein n=1 Tax=Volvox carteri f. nagariensis TaxID=3068 RepID=D8U7K2_VOLCA|nr:kelch repeat protein [Volvox carteri f. nagariensis]EFJ44314.1 kelch repeat protein [Volvox carteri f. nagariensis]|eukprot:XP_002954673.1 kelch repeat protein [Volvox carteri f. nagariensis]
MRWTRLPQAGTLPVERSSHSITVVGDKIVLFGGEHDPRVPISSELYAYSFTDGTWRVLDAIGEPPSPRVAHSAAAIGNTLYIFGGRSGLDMGEGASNDLYAFDLETSTWSQLQPKGDLPPKRSYHTMTAVGTKLYVFGGCGEEGRLNDLHEYDVTTETWRPLAKPPAEAVPGRGGSCLVAARKPGGEVDEPLLYVIAGFCGRELDDMHVYSIAEDAWCGASCPSCGPSAAAEEKLSARSVFGAGVHSCDLGECGHRNVVLVYGGEVDPSDKGHDGAGDFCSSLVEFGSGARACGGGEGKGHGAGWRVMEAGGDSPGPRGWFASATTSDGRLVIHGGLDGNNERLGDLYVLDVHAN